MKLIRDIINEKRANSKLAELGLGSKPALANTTKPLVLNTPAGDTAPEASAAAAQTQAEGIRPSAPSEELFDVGFSAAFFDKVAAKVAAPEDTPVDAPAFNAPSEADESYSEEYEDEDAYAATSEYENKLTFDDDEDYEDDEYEPEMDMASDFGLDDFAPTSPEEEMDAVLAAKPEPFAKLDQPAAAPPTSPSPLRQTAQPDPVVETSEPPTAPTASVEEFAAVGSAVATEPESSDAGPLDLPAPTVGRSSSRSGRVKTRLLGFSAAEMENTNPFEKAASKSDGLFPVGWLVVVSDMGRGSAYSLYDGVSKVGRGLDQTVSLNFGDNSISRENHISIAYDAEQNKFFIGHSGKTNLVRVNNTPLLSTQELFSKDLIRLGETTLRFVALCQSDFRWDEPQQDIARHA